MILILRLVFPMQMCIKCWLILIDIRPIKYSCFYPATVGSCIDTVKQIEIVDEFADRLIRVQAHQLPIINEQLMEQDSFPKMDSLETIFIDTKTMLSKALQKVLLS